MSRYPVLVALVIQVLAVALASLLSAFWPSMPWPLWVGGQSAAAFMLCYCVPLRWWWRGFSALFVPALLLIDTLAIAHWIYLALFLLVWLVARNAWHWQVPLALSSSEAVEKLAQLLQGAQTDARFIDLGCGIGSVLCPLAKRYQRLEFVGVENAPLSYAIAKWRARGLPNCQIRYQNLWLVNLADYQWVYSYLSPTPMRKLWHKACREMRPGAWLISNQMPIHEARPLQTLDLANGASALLLWQPAAAGESR